MPRGEWVLCSTLHPSEPRGGPSSRARPALFEQCKHFTPPHSAQQLQQSKTMTYTPQIPGEKKEALYMEPRRACERRTRKCLNQGMKFFKARFYLRAPGRRVRPHPGAHLLEEMNFASNTGPAAGGLA